jgi:hypothetical protein
MKKIILLSACGFISLYSCQKKTDVTPATTETLPLVVTTPVPAVRLDSIPDGGILKLKLQQDSTPIDETLVRFEHTAPSDFSNTIDAAYFTGFGIGSLASITTDGIPCMINTRPFTRGQAIKLKVTAKQSGIYTIRISYASKLPKNMGIWLKDAYKKDSLDLKLWNYRFNVIETDTNTFGSERFTLVLR